MEIHEITIATCDKGPFQIRYKKPSVLFETVGLNTKRILKNRQDKKRSAKYQYDILTLRITIL